ncbi:MAG: acetylglutamate kinase [Fimbriimonadaceae bacterium]|nr:MAG: acetylglutamate kinase [Fimbriimonadaceae bacterium]
MELISVQGLRAALPYIRKFSGSLFVFKLGGEALESTKPLDSIVEQLTLLHQLGIRFVVVHGGGSQSTELLGRLGVASEFVDGRRVTSAEAIKGMVMSLNGTARTAILSSCRRHRLPAIGLSGIDAAIIRAEKRPPTTATSGAPVDYGFVGDVLEVDPAPLRHLLDAGIVPIVSCLAADDAGTVLNINADTVASALAVSLRAAKLIVLMKPRGVLQDVSDPLSLLSELTLAELKGLETDQRLNGGMLPKAKAIEAAILGGVGTVHLISYEVPDSIMVEVFTNEGCGTMVVAGEGV